MAERDDMAQKNATALMRGEQQSAGHRGHASVADEWESTAEPAASRDFAGKRVLITGAGSGIGLATAHALARAGASIGAVVRSAKSEEAVRQACVMSPNVATALADVQDEAGFSAAVERLAAALGGIDAVVASAGISGPFGASVGEISAVSFAEVLNVNVVGSFLAVKAALPFLRQSPSASAVIVGSDSGFVVAPGMLPYVASKGAIRQLTAALSYELYEDGIRVNAVCPSVVDTPMSRRDLQQESFSDAEFPVQSAHDVANVICYLLSDKARTVNGVSLLSDFGYARRSSFPA
ncbi:MULTISPECIES: SDR family NAD(P)-dependent oxidoreductase [Bifidobacterium]|jgi:NAD(P)-dependent dehydrogenase (short-subunit alcohol dehydrogenase family)|nr:SDR family oxidoreductase [Bifidobacterium tibiigranuli]MCI1212301.1 SDR family oxidoreductase [Bifidobacterium tibiigranuli]MCI1221486.1 SDR family oxidoreductase [Bifidobacterium tibiigranuli]MCI1232655.1 SDR family oxidoreductase [Bifidobacterium tibiigranuli]MCI1254301.1 SDR family oxidoreductase [Bifidobacterium tibiigranuli]